MQILPGHHLRTGSNAAPLIMVSVGLLRGASGRVVYKYFRYSDSRRLARCLAGFLAAIWFIYRLGFSKFGALENNVSGSDDG